jgi:hypothetical protein
LALFGIALLRTGAWLARNDAEWISIGIRSALASVPADQTGWMDRSFLSARVTVAAQ